MRRLNKFLSEINPSVKFFSVLVYILLLIISMNKNFIITLFIISFLFFIISVSNNKKYIVPISITVIIFSLTIFVMNFVFYKAGRGIFAIAYIKGTKAGFDRGIILGLRSASIILFSVSYLFTTPPFRFIESLMQNLKLPKLIGYSLLIALREVHQFRNNFRNTRNALLIRKNGHQIVMIDYMRLIVPLFACIIRKGERSAIALELRGIMIHKDKMFYNDFSVKQKDILFLLISLCFLCIIFCFFTFK
ncbi:hypothetical protein DRP43_04850 [candidate division TA06 bacterium]|uniref:Energy-coupling factor transporter transmembrane protein EcfT n=1 Tax=candidate division TA06 bacterium TaxID=2250710 RepID=A0A660SED2_UNCT6|nr:MAG: hypothetical protein DRP43_04850 [candidate division TA06 bacterium]